MSLLAGAREIAVFRALQLGDLLCTIPAVRALRAAAPDARVTLIGLPWAKTLVSRFPDYFDDFIEFPGFPGMPERECDPAAFTGFLRTAQGKRFDVALQLHGSGQLSNPIVALLGARRTAGHYRYGEYCPDAALFAPWRAEQHEVERYARLIRGLGAPDRGLALEFPLRADDYAELARIEPLRAVRGRHYVCIHPGSQLQSRRWFAERFAAVGDALAAAGLRVVLTGTAKEAHLTRSVADAMHAPAIDLAGRTTLGAVAALIDGARLLVANDTGVVHVAGARRTPTVVISCGGDPRRWAPLDPALQRVLFHAVECRPCAHAACPLEQHPCAAGVKSTAVVASAAALLASTAVRAHQRGAQSCVH